MEAMEMKLMEYEPLIRRHKHLSVAALNRVLIVEDDMSLTNMLSTVLEEIAPNIVIDWATSGEEAQLYIERESLIFGASPYDLIIADIFLEGAVTGLDIWKLCDRQYPATDILVMSSLSLDKFLSCLKHEIACPHYLAKPFSLSQCKDVFSRFLDV